MTRIIAMFAKNLVTLEAVAKHELLFNRPHRFVCLISKPDLSATRIIYLDFVNLVTPKVGVKHEVLFNRPHRSVCLISKSDLSIKTKCDPNHISDFFKFGHT